MTRTVLRSLLVSTAAAAVLAGCGSAQAGAAATLDGRRISVSDVQSATTDAQTWVGQNGRVVQYQVLYLLAADPFLQEIAAGYGAAASESDARAVLAQSVPNPSPAAVEVIRANITLTKLQEGLGDQRTAQILGQVTQKLADAHFTVNPRYGTFDAKSGRVTAVTPNWLEGSEATPTPSQ